MIAVIEIILFTYLAACILFNLGLAIAGRTVRKKHTTPRNAAFYSRIAILIPAYKEDAIILSSVQSYKALQYPAGKYEVIVIADSLQPDTLQQLESTGVTVIPVSFVQSTKAKSLNAAFHLLGDSYDMALICDADNMLSPDFLQHINHAYQRGEYAIQGQRMAKNMDTPFAILDAANEIIANHLYRKGANALGLSSSVIGSGMAFHYPLIKSVLRETEAVGGFDKVLQLKIVAAGHRICYLEEARIFDEKIAHPEAFSNQRKRWLSSQFVYLRKYWKSGWKQLFSGNINYFNLAVCQNLLLPRMLLIAAVTALTAVYIIAQDHLRLPLAAWAILFILNGVSLLLPIPGVFYRHYLFTALLNLPRALLIMVGLVFKLKGANNRFIHTQHSKTVIDNPLLNAVRK